MFVHSARFFRPFLCEHDIRSHGVLRPAYNVVAGVEEEAVLEQQYSAILGGDIETPLHVVRVESGGTSYERLLPSAVICVVEVQMQSKVRSLFAVWRLVRAVTVSYTRQ